MSRDHKPDYGLRILLALVLTLIVAALTAGPHPRHSTSQVCVNVSEGIDCRAVTPWTR